LKEVGRRFDEAGRTKKGGGSCPKASKILMVKLHRHKCVRTLNGADITGAKRIVLGL
jgi:hypothetical protein